jgi:hypothetical protein
LNLKYVLEYAFVSGHEVRTQLECINHVQVACCPAASK